GFGDGRRPRQCLRQARLRIGHRLPRAPLVADVQHRRQRHHDRRDRACGGVLLATATERLRVAAAVPRLDRYLADNVTGLTRTAAGRLAREGHVRVNGKPARPADLVQRDDIVESERAAPIATRPQPEAIPLEVLYEDADLVVVVKPAGMVAHPAAGHHTGTLVHALLGLGGSWSATGGAARPGLVHRLDKDTSGLLVAARTDVAHLALSAQLGDRSMSRTYQAIALGRVAGPAGVLEGDIGRHPR